jgi:hypothetical protein
MTTRAQNLRKQTTAARRTAKPAKPPPSPAERARRAARVRRTARGQHGLITHAQALAAGLSHRQIRYRVRGGSWSEPRPGVYSTTAALDSWEAAVLAVVLAIPGAVASHRTALWLHGIARLGKSDVIEVTVPFGYNRSLPGVRTHQSRSLAAVDQTSVRNVPTMTAARTVIDLAGQLGIADRLAVLDEAICSRAARRKVVYARALALRFGRRGVRIIIEATRPGAERNFRSWLERHAATVLAEAGLPTPRWNVTLTDRRGRIGTVDAVLGPRERIVLEFDGLRFHSTPAQRQRDVARDRRVLLTGRIPLRFTYEDVVRRPAQMIAEIREALGSCQPQV